MESKISRDEVRTRGGLDLKKWKSQDPRTKNYWKTGSSGWSEAGMLKVKNLEAGKG